MVGASEKSRAFVDELSIFSVASICFSVASVEDAMTLLIVVDFMVVELDDVVTGASVASSSP